MIDAGVVVRFCCEKCRTVMDVDLHAIALVRGRSFSLIDVRPQCKVTMCRGPGFFLASPGETTPLRPLVTDAARLRWILGETDPDPEEPPPSGGPPRSGAPAVDPFTVERGRRRSRA